jgi:1,4-alpha-glucan branching enzyme
VIPEQVNKQDQLQQGLLHDPFEVLGLHREGQSWVVRVFMPNAEEVELEEFGSMTRRQGTDLFEISLSRRQTTALPPHYSIIWTEKGTTDRHTTISPYTFDKQVGDLDQHWFAEGRHLHAYRFLGAHLKTIDDIEGCQFAVWAPGVKRVSVVGDFNGWHGLRHPMRNRGYSGIWELFIPGLCEGDTYQFEILTQQDEPLIKVDPYAQRMSMRPDINSLITQNRYYPWQDGDWMSRRKHWDWQHSPVSIYELHPGSWQRDEHGGFMNYRDIAPRLIEYVKALGYTHIELMPVMEHPLDESWGYQVTGFFAPTARFGSPDDFRFLIDECHRHDIGVLLDWVPGHFPRDAHALAQFTGEPTYEHADPMRGEHKDWGTLIFDYGRQEVKNFLISNAVYWLEEFHIDGLRVDAVASMLYLDYSREEGEWVPNEFGGRENLEAIAFLKELNEVVHAQFPGALTIAEESTAWPMVSRPVYMGGLGFSMKWNMGWMNDSLEYMQEDAIHRKYHHDKLTFSQIYAYSENFVLPFSHDEVVHLKHSMLSKMPGDVWQKHANLRLLYAWQYAHPGKKLLFMGSEFGQWEEWGSGHALNWQTAGEPAHRGLQQLVADLNRIYRDMPALHERDFSQQGFQWIDPHDSDQSVLSFVRWSESQHVICILNFTPVPRMRYRIGVPESGSYSEILNTDSSYYGGSNAGNEGELHTSGVSWTGMPDSLELSLPPLGALLLAKTVSH